MPEAKLPDDEAARLATLESYEILDTGSDWQFEALVRLTADIYDVPITAISLIAGNRQWFKARAGLIPHETPRSMAFCAHAILAPDEVLVVEDATIDPRFSDNSLVLGEPGIRFYAGAPIKSPDGHALGSLCIIDRKPRTLDAAARRRLAELAGSVSSVLELHRGKMLSRRSEKQDLHQAITVGGLRHHWQPVRLLATGQTVGHEALMRWNRPGHGPVSPDQFIPLAEASGLIVDLDAQSLESACRAAATWTVPHHAAVNISANSFSHGRLPNLVADALRRTGLAGNRLVIELTERTLIDHSDACACQIAELHAMGVRLALDDFGIGYSSLGYLKRFPFDTLKLDRSFVEDLARDVRADAITRAVLALAAALGMQVCAEGVETEAQLQFLRAAGCQMAQGWLLGRPSAVPQFG
jgi:EAL domain-containing protein (putative c-di-GMP-specific phosphodiesterase class I)